MSPCVVKGTLADGIKELETGVAWHGQGRPLSLQGPQEEEGGGWGGVAWEGPEPRGATSRNASAPDTRKACGNTAPPACFRP